MTARFEQETTVTAGRDDEWTFIWTNNPIHARRLEKDPRVIRTDRGGEFGGQYKILSADFDPLKGFKRRGKPMTDEQRSAAAARLANARQKGTTNEG